ncbi:MAG: DUF1810 family protein [Bacteroidia bacterium]
MLCHVRRNLFDVYSIKTAESVYINTTIYGGDINKKFSLAWYVNQYWKGIDSKPEDPIMKMTFDNWRNNPNWRFSIERFQFAQEQYFEKAYDEINLFSRKLTHWISFIFPQVDYLGRSDMSKFYSLSFTMTKKYLRSEVLMNNMRKMLSLLMEIEDKSAYEIVGRNDSQKVLSSLTLFHLVSILEFGEDRDFEPVMKKYFGSKFCQFTHNYLEMNILTEVMDMYLAKFTK